MKNSIKSFLCFIVFFLNLHSVSFSGEEFIFNVTEIKISDNGNQINGYKGGTVKTEDGDEIIAKEFSYNK